MLKVLSKIIKMTNIYHIYEAISLTSIFLGVSSSFACYSSTTVIFLLYFRFDTTAKKQVSKLKIINKQAPGWLGR